MSSTEKINILANLNIFFRAVLEFADCQIYLLHLWDKLHIGHVWTLVVLHIFLISHGNWLHLCGCAELIQTQIIHINIHSSH